MPSFAEALSGGQLVVLGLMLVAAGVVLRRRTAQRGRPRRQDPLQEVQAEFQRIEASHSGRITKLEVRLHDFAREVEGRIETRLALLDQLIQDADREITDLERLLDEARDSGHTPRTIPTTGRADERHTIFTLADAGLTPDEIAIRLNQSLGRVLLLLNLRQTHDQSDAA